MTVTFLKDEELDSLKRRIETTEQLKWVKELIKKSVDMSLMVKELEFQLKKVKKQKRISISADQ